MCAQSNYFWLDEDGGEYVIWPSHGLRFTWPQVEKIVTRKQFGLIQYSALKISNAEFAGPALGHRLRALLGILPEQIVPLSGFRGWPDGVLVTFIESHAPGLLSDAHEHAS